MNGRICDNIRFKKEETDEESFGILDHQFVFWVRSEGEE